MSGFQASKHITIHHMPSVKNGYENFVICERKKKGKESADLNYCFDGTNS